MSSEEPQMQKLPQNVEIPSADFRFLDANKKLKKYLLVQFKFTKFTDFRRFISL